MSVSASGALTRRLVHPTAPVLLTKSSPLGTLNHRPTFSSRKDSTTIESIVHPLSGPNVCAQASPRSYKIKADRRCAPRIYAGDSDKNHKLLCARGFDETQ
ncbi:hypothetical protein NPIL_425721 [Nephila pilipes]|uniref:Uncharacterized protein n=1 Tax=Nephila pilipes TaxID=299642 RepID=A0A8X6Q7S9_NEPPI|nr:hypothetical protein NPIL_425721 [Nephila pilipes]